MAGAKDIVRSTQMYQQYAQFGTIRKGAPKSNGKWGADLTHFRFDINPEYKALLEPALLKIYGEKPKVLDRCYVVGNTADDSFSFYYEDHGGNQSLKIQCDGDQQIRYLQEDGLYCTIPKACARNATPKCTCTLSGRMNVILFDLCLAVGLWGSFKMVTGSKKDCSEIYSKLKGAEMMMNGRIIGVPFTIQRKMDEIFAVIKKDGKSVRSKIKKSFIIMDVDTEYMSKKMLPAMEQALALGSGEKFLTGEEFTEELNARKLDKKEAWALITQWGLHNMQGPDRFTVWLQHIDTYIGEMPLLTVGEEIDVTDGDFVEQE